MEHLKQSGSLNCNYKKFYSLVLLAICDANYCFTHVDIGHYGSGNDSENLENYQMMKGFENDSVNIRSPSNYYYCYFFH